MSFFFSTTSTPNVEAKKGKVKLGIILQVSDSTTMFIIAMSKDKKGSLSRH